MLVHPDFKDLYCDQFAFKPTVSTTAALINLVYKISVLCENNEFVHLIGLDFSKAFDSVHNSNLIDKISQLPIPNFILNLLVVYLNSRHHCTKFKFCNIQNYRDKSQFCPRLTDWTDCLHTSSDLRSKNDDNR